MLTVKNADIAVIWMKGNYTCLVSSINDPVLNKLRSFVVPLSTKYVLLSNKLHEFEDQCEAKQSRKSFGLCFCERLNFTVFRNLAIHF